MMIAAATTGTGSGGKFALARVAEDGTTYGGVTGDGRIKSFDISILEEQIALSLEPSAQYDIYLCSFNQVYGASTATPIATTPGCSGSRLPPLSVGTGYVRLAWVFSTTDNRLVLIAARGDTYALDVEHMAAMAQRYDPPALYGTTKIDSLNALYVVSVYAVDKDLYPRLPSVSL